MHVMTMWPGARNSLRRRIHSVTWIDTKPIQAREWLPLRCLMSENETQVLYGIEPFFFGRRVSEQREPSFENEG
jgi:hypothetical protein